MIRPDTVFLDFVENGIPFRDHARGIRREPDKVPFPSVRLLRGTTKHSEFWRCLKDFDLVAISNTFNPKRESCESRANNNHLDPRSRILDSLGKSHRLDTPFSSLHSPPSFKRPSPILSTQPSPPTPNSPPARSPTSRPSQKSPPGSRHRDRRRARARSDRIWHPANIAPTPHPK